LPLFVGLSALVAGLPQAGEVRPGPAPALREAPVLALRETGTVSLSRGGYLAWAGQAACDEDRNLFLLVIPTLGPPDPQDTPAEGRDPLNPRDVLRLGADGKDRTTFSPGACTKLAGAKDIMTVAATLDREGTLHMLVWASWAEKTGQFLVPFDRKGKPGSARDIDAQQILVHQFAVFGSGEFLLLGRRTDTDEARLAILSDAGLRDVLDHPTELSKEAVDGAADYRYMARGDDGRIYLIRPDGPDGREVVYTVTALGDVEKAFTLAPMRGSPRLSGLQASGGRLAATYLERDPSTGATSGELRGRWWIAVYDNLADAGALQAIYGPAPGPPVCYEHRDSMDRFSFLKDGSRIVRMSP
jgi:hypothetical protein